MRRVTKAIESARFQPVPNGVPKRRKWRTSDRILVAANLTVEGGELVTWALAQSSSGDAVNVIHIVEPCPPWASRAHVTKWEREKGDMLNVLSNVVKLFRAHHDKPDLSIVVEVVEHKSVRDAIVQEARSLEATKVVLGKHKSRRLDISKKRMTSLGSLCVQSLEPYCEVFIVRKDKVLIRKHGTAKTRRSLETLLFSNQGQEISLSSHEAADREKQLATRLTIVDVLSKMDDSKKVSLDPKDSWHLTQSSSFEKSSSSFGSSSSSSTSSGTFSAVDYSHESSCSSGMSEISPKTVLRIANKENSSSGQKGGDKTDRSSELLQLVRFNNWEPFPQSSQAELSKASSTVPHSRSRSSSKSLESVTELSLTSVPELPEQAVEVVNQSKESELVVFNPLQSEKRKDDADDKLTLVCVSQPESESEEYNRIIGEYLDALVSIIAPEPDIVNEGEERALVLFDKPQLDLEEKRHHGQEEPRDEARAIVLSSFFTHEEKDNLRGEEADHEGQSEQVCMGGCSPPKFARTCSAIRYNLSEEGLQSLSKDLNLELPEVRRFSYEELRLATDDFSPRNVVGTGGASSVYRGKLTDGRWVAIKKLVDETAGEKEIMMEMMMLTCTLNHPNLVTMLGFCAEGPRRLIAYNLLARGSLERNLHAMPGSPTSRSLNWEQRQKVAFGASRGLAYLHNFSPNPIIHRDIKTSNILLGDDFEAQISDFGLARWVSEDDSAIFDEQVSCAGTFGYLAPECLMYGGFNERTDIFAFGVVLLELISGKRPMDESLPDTSLVLWARTLQQNGRTHCLVDKSLEDINAQQFKRMMYTAFLCVQIAPEDRPTMDRVVKLLDPDCNYSPAILQPNISAPPFMSMPELSPISPSGLMFSHQSSSSSSSSSPSFSSTPSCDRQQSSSSQSPSFSSSPSTSL